MVSYQAKAIIEEAVVMGAESGVVMSDRRFAGADVLATAYTLSEGIKRLGEFDLIICGKQTTDGYTAQVGAEIAEYLGIPNVSCVLSVDDIQNGKNYLSRFIKLLNKLVKKIFYYSRKMQALKINNRRVARCRFALQQPHKTNIFLQADSISLDENF